MPLSDVLCITGNSFEFPVIHKGKGCALARKENSCLRNTRSARESRKRDSISCRLILTKWFTDCKLIIVYN